MKKYGIVGIVLSLMPCIYGDSYEADYVNLFINNKTDHNLMIRFFNEDREQQQYPMAPNEHRFVKVKMVVMQRLFFVRVTMKDPENPHKTIMKEIDYQPNTGINRLKIVMKPDLDLRWGYEGEKRRDDDEDETSIA